MSNNIHLKNWLGFIFVGTLYFPLFNLEKLINLSDNIIFILGGALPTAVFLPLMIFLLFGLINKLRKRDKKKKWNEIYVSVWILFLLLLVISGLPRIGQIKNGYEELMENHKLKTPQSRSDSKNDLFEESYKERISKANNTSFIDYYDSISNLYSNFKYNFAIKIPKYYSQDKGISEHTIIRATQKDSAVSLSVNVIEIKTEGNFNKTIWDLYKNNRNFYDVRFKNKLSKSLNSKIYNHSLEKQYMYNHEALKREFNYTVKHQQLEYEMKSILYQVVRSPYIYTIGIHVPSLFYNHSKTYYKGLLSENFYYLKMQ